MLKILAQQKSKSDWLGIIGSTLCALHCAFTPFAIAAFSALETAKNEWAWLDYAFIGLCLWAVFHSSKHSSSPKIRVGLWAAWSVFTVGILFEDAAEGMNYVGYTGSIALVILHVLNIRYFKHCKNCTH